MWEAVVQPTGCVASCFVLLLNLPTYPPIHGGVVQYSITEWLSVLSQGAIVVVTKVGEWAVDGGRFCILVPYPSTLDPSTRVRGVGLHKVRIVKGAERYLRAVPKNALCSMGVPPKISLNEALNAHPRPVLQDPNELTFGCSGGNGDKTPAVN